MRHVERRVISADLFDDDAQSLQRKVLGYVSSPTLFYLLSQLAI